MTGYNGASGKKTATRTIRIEEDVDAGLMRLASKEKVSVNFLVNNALRRYVEWGSLALKFGIVTNFSGASKRMMEYLSDEEVKELGRWVGKNQFKEYVMFWYKTVDLESTLRSIELLGNSGNYQYEEHVNGEIHTSVFKHDCGLKWSLYYEQVFRSVFEDVLKIRAITETTEDQVLLEFAASSRGFPSTHYDEPLRIVKSS